MKRLPKVQATAAFIDRSGKLKCAGPHSALPFNPAWEPEWPRFRISFNGRWHTVAKVEAHEDIGWIAASVDDLDREARAEMSVSPRVELRR